MHNLTKMKNHQIISFLLLTFFVFSCKEKPKKTQLSEHVENLEPKITLNELETNFIKWWTYYSKNISLSSNFIGLNGQSDTIGKKEFLEKLISSNYIPVKLKSNEKFETYKLFKLNSKASKSIRSTIKNESLTILKYYKMEGLPFPEFDFTDLYGNLYTNKNTKGKIIILKTWFINCKACVEEFPELNELVEKHKQINDIIFVSLALDSKSELERFLQKNIFEYKVVPNQRDFIEKKLNLHIYPTHIIIDRNGIILKVVNKASEMIEFLDNEKKLTENIPSSSPPTM